jgi:hypothetical protein
MVTPFGPGAHEAHLAAKHIPELRQFVEIPAAHDRANAPHARIVACGALLRRVARRQSF